MENIELKSEGNSQTSFKFNIGDPVWYNEAEHTIISRLNPENSLIREPFYLLNMIGQPIQQSRLNPIDYI